MYLPSFNGCWAKVERAKEHRDSLDTYLREEVLIEGNSPTLAMKFKPKTSEYILYIDTLPDFGPMMERIGVLIGDFAHNLRGALDHLVYQLALIHLDGQLLDERRIQMPIEDEPVGFLQRCHFRNRGGGWIRQLSPKDWAIIKAYQPYDGRHLDTSMNLHFHPLAVLRDLSNRDKHRLLAEVWLPTAGFKFPSMNAAAIIYMGSMFLRFTNPKTPLVVRAELGAEVARIRQPRNDNIPDEMKMCGYVTPHIVLTDLDVPIVGMLDRIAAAVTNLIREFDPVP